VAIVGNDDIQSRGEPSPGADVAGLPPSRRRHVFATKVKDLMRVVALSPVCPRALSTPA
jgi:hypothetical protein